MDKKILFMSGLLSTTVISLLAMVQYPPQGAVAEQAIVVPFTTLTEGEQSGVSERVNYLITSPLQLAELWKTVHGTSTPPTIDFATQEVLAIFGSMSIAKITDAPAAGQRLVSLVIVEPNESCADETPNVSSYAIVAVPATSLELAHEDIVTTASCPN